MADIHDQLIRYCEQKTAVPRYGSAKPVFKACMTCSFYVNGLQCKKFREIKHSFSLCDYYYRSERWDYYYYVYDGVRFLFEYDSFTACLTDCERLPGTRIYGVNDFCDCLLARL